MASQNNVRSFQITNGPSKFDLMVSLFEGNPKHRRTVSFTLSEFQEEVKVAISGIQQESGGGESWNWEGQDVESGYSVKGYFGTKGRHGHLKFVAPYTNVWDDEKKTYVQGVDPMEEHLLEKYIKSRER